MMRQGFSLVELVMVMVIVTIISVIAAPRVASALARQRADGAARRVIADLGLAQREARAASAGRSITFDVANSRYTLVGVSNLDQRGAAYTVDLGGEPYTSTLVSVNFAGGTTLTFDGYGKPGSGGTVMIRTGNGCRQIAVNTESGAADVAEVACPSG